MKPIEDEATFDLAEYYHLLMRHKWIILASIAIVVGLVLRYNSRLVPIYRATATLIIDKEMARSPVTGQPSNYETYLSESLTFNTHFELITSRPVIEKVVNDLELDKIDKQLAEEELAEIRPFRQFLSRLKNNLFLLFGGEKAVQTAEQPKNSLYGVVKGLVEIESIEDTRLLKIHASSPNPERAKDVANALGQAYIAFNISNRMKASRDTLSWLTDRLYEMKKKLENAEQEFLDYKQQVKLISVKDKLKMIAQKMTEFNDAYLRTKSRRLELETILDQLEKISESDKDIPFVRALIDNKLINDLHSQMVEAELERTKLSKVYKFKHPKTIQINSRIEQIRKKLTQEIKKEVVNLKAERAVLLAKEQALQKTIVDFEKEGIETNKRELQHSMLERNVEMNKQLYDALFVRLKEADLTGNVDVSNIRITEKAEQPTAPMGPNKKRNLILGLILGIIIGVGIAFLIEYFERTLRTEEDVQKYLGLPVLSVIPIAEKSKQKMYGNHPTQKDE
jgi:polysaccharide biosynthesis transport protein